MKRFIFSFVTAGLLLAAASCRSSTVDPVAPAADAGGPAPPPRVCKTPPPAPPMPWFTEITSDVGLGRTDALTPLATNVLAVDLDGDGFADLVTRYGAATRGPQKDGTYAGKRTRRLFMSRPDAGDPKRRVFVDATESSGVTATRDGKGDRGWNLANAADLDNDGDVDLVLCSADPLAKDVVQLDPCDAFLNDGKGHFTLAPPSDLGAKAFWIPSAALLDYDRDGVLDFWPATIAHWPYDPGGPNKQPPTLFRGGGDGTFANVSAEVGLPTKDGTLKAGTRWRHVFGVTACDIDGDGDDDMIFASYGRQENQVWRNDDGHFTNVAAQLGIDHDDRTDVSDDQSYRCYCQGNPGACPASVLPPTVGSFCNVFNQPNGRGWLPGVSDAPYSLGGNNFAFACGDIDDDGDMDLMSATIVHGDVGSAADPTELILNPGNGGKFTRPGNETNGLDRPETGIYWNHGDDAIVFVDFDLDGRKDILSTTTGAYGDADRARLWHQKPDRTFEEIAIPAGLVPKSLATNIQGPAWVDVDGDGDLDLVVGDTKDGTLRVFRNDVGAAQNSIRIRLVGSGAGGSNVSAIGAIVRVTAGGKTQTDHVKGGYGIGVVQADLPLTFGLGAACDIDRIEVRWPDSKGTVTRHEKVMANYAITLREGQAAVEYAR